MEKTLEKFEAAVDVFDVVDREWKRGHHKDIAFASEVIALEWSGLGDVTDVAPLHDEHIDVLFARTIAIQIDTTHASNTSTDLDINVEASQDRATWDTVPYAEMNVGDAAVRTFLVAPGPAYIRLRADQNDTSESGDVTCRVLVVK